MSLLHQTANTPLLSTKPNPASPSTIRNSNSPTEVAESIYPSIFPNKFLTKRLSVDQVNYKNRCTRTKTVNEYTLGEVLGEGSYGKVREAFNTQDKKLYAIKVLKKSNLKRIPFGEENVMKEISILQQINHPHCIKLFKYFKQPDSENLYIVLDYVGGTSLMNLLERAPNRILPLCQARSIFTQLLDALGYLHSIGIVHRDIKPDNILINERGKIKLSDFGSAVDLKVNDNPKKSAGCVAFQPPEVVSGTQNGASYCIDLWQAGLLLYIMAVGKYPFDGSALQSLIENISNCSFTIPDTLDSQLADLIRNMLCLKSEERLTIEKINEHPWMKMDLPHEDPILPDHAPSLFKKEQHCCCLI